MKKGFIFHCINDPNSRLYHRFLHQRSSPMEHLLIENYDHCCNRDASRPGRYMRFKFGPDTINQHPRWRNW
jgi:hypothetical protein